MFTTTGTVLVTGILLGMIHRSSCQPFQISKDNLGKELVGHSVWEMDDVNHHDCARKCMSLAICKSIDYDTTENTCKINDVDKSSVDPSEFKGKKGSIFSNIEEWPNAIVKGCGSRPCAVNQRCYDNGLSYVCKDIICDSGLEIKHGKIQINELGENRFLDKADVKCNFGYAPSLRQVMCLPSGHWQSATCELLSDCKEILVEFPMATSGQYDIKLWESSKLVTVNCDMETEGGGWTACTSCIYVKIFHKRIDGSVEFYRNFTEYENGFGNIDGELWLGLKYIQEIAEQGATELRIDMTNANDEKGQETFQDFRLTDGIKYRLNIGTRSASANIDESEGLQINAGHSFSTFDRDTDSRQVGNCAVQRHGAWWYEDCSYVNPNGIYATPGTEVTFPGAETGGCGHVYRGFDGFRTLKTSSMMLRRK